MLGWGGIGWWGSGVGTGGMAPRPAGVGGAAIQLGVPAVHGVVAPVHHPALQPPPLGAAPPAALQRRFTPHEPLPPLRCLRSCER